MSPRTAPAGGRRGPNAYTARKIAQGVRAASRETCRTCGGEILVGPDDRVLAVTARVETYPTDAVGEVLARGLYDRGSFDVDRLDGVVTITRRDRWTARARPGVPTYGGAVHLAHDCREAARPEPPEPPPLFDYSADPPF
jgi:hypothetical protein